jgi:cytochrome c biogenesis protein CcmG, thiol:disulfide interchange protein DsbE
MGADPTVTEPGRRSVVGIALRWLGALAAAGFVGLLLYGVTAQAPDRTIDDALARAEGVDAPGFELDVLQRGRAPAPLASVVERAAADGRLALAELRGTPVVLNFWASWCDPCRAEAPVLERGWREAGRQGVLFLGLDMQDARDDAREFLREFSITYPNVREAGDETSRRYGMTGIPETFFISARGQVVGHVIGAISSGQLRSGVAAARSGRPAQASEGGDRQPTQ